MDIKELVESLYINKPKPACTQRIEIQEGNSINEQFEIITLIILEGFERKLVTNPEFDLTKDQKKFVRQICILLKLYLASIGIKINIDIITKKDIKKLTLTRSPNFFVIKKFKYNFACLYNYYKNGKQKVLYYNPKSKMSHFSDGFLMIKISNYVFKVTMKEY